MVTFGHLSQKMVTFGHLFRVSSYPKVIFILDSLKNNQKTTAISKISRIFVANHTHMAKFYQDISASGGTIRTHELREPRAYYGINKGIKSGNVIRIKNGESFPVVSFACILRGIIMDLPLKSLMDSTSPLKNTGKWWSLRFQASFSAIGKRNTARWALKKLKLLIIGLRFSV